MTTRTQRHRQFNVPPERQRFRVAATLRTTLSAGYTGRDFRADLMAGVVVGIVALPLAMALAIASGVPPQYGLYTAIVAGTVIPIFGGSRVNVSGPTAAFVVLLAPIASQYGVAGLVIATLMAGILLLIMGLARLGRLIQFIPHPVTTGFTAGIAVVLATLQVKDFFGLEVGRTGDHYWERVAGLAESFSTFKTSDLAIGLLTLLILIVWPRFTKRIPGPLIAVAAGAAAAAICHSIWPAFSVETIGTRFSFIRPDGTLGAGIPTLPPVPVLPWNLPGPGGAPLAVDFSMIRSLLAPAFAIAMLGAIESLLCAVVADGMAGTKHDPDMELVGQGLGNIVAPFFGGIAATGAIARTATNVRAGGRSPLACIFHAQLVLLAMVLLGSLLAYLPMASLAALLFIVAWNMSDLRHFGHMLKVAPKSDLTVLMTCFTLTVIFDMVIAVGVGVVLASILFMRRMAETSGSRLVTRSESPRLSTMPDDVLFYEIAGPLFFGAAEKATNALRRVPVDARAAILSIEEVPAMDITGLVALETVIRRLQNAGMHVYIVGIQPQPARVLAKGGIGDEPGKLTLCRSLDDAMARVQEAKSEKANDAS